MGRPLLRVSMALVLTFGAAGIGRVTTPAPATAGGIDPCLLLEHPFANDDPEVAGDPAWRTLEEQTLQVQAPGFLANDQCYAPGTVVEGLGRLGGNDAVYNDGYLSFIPDEDFAGQGYVVYRFTSNYGTSNNAMAYIDVVPVNDQPSFHEAAGPTCIDYNAAEDSGQFTSACSYYGNPGGGSYEASQTVTGHALAQDPEFFSVQPAFAPGTIASPGKLTYTPAKNVNGSTQIEIWVTDNGGTSNGGDREGQHVFLPVTITSVDDAPTAKNDAYTTPFGSALVVSAANGVLKNDSDIDSTGLTSTILASTTHGTVTLQKNGAFTYTPQAGYSGPDSFSYLLAAGGQSDGATVSLTVLGAGATPVPTSPPATAAPAISPAPTSVPASPPASLPPTDAPSAAPAATAAVSSAPSATPTNPPTGFSPAPSAPVVDPNAAAGGEGMLLLVILLAVVALGGALLLRRRRSS